MGMGFTLEQKEMGRLCWMPLVLLVTGFVIPAVGWAAEGGDGDQDCNPPDVPVRGTLTATNNDPGGRTANDFHFYMYQNDRDSVQVTGATVSSGSFGSAGVTLGTDDGTGSPPPGNHGAQVDLTDGEVPAGGQVSVNIQVCMNERNCLKFKEFVWTYDDQPDPTPRAVGGGGGWRIGRPYAGGNGGNTADPSGGGRGAQQGGGGSGNFVHLVSFENDHPVLCMEITELKLLASMTLYTDTRDIREGGEIDWAGIAPVRDFFGRPPVIVHPGDSWCFPFETTGSYLGGHIYSRFQARWITCPKSAGNKPGEEGADTQQIGDHPVDALAADGDFDGLPDSFEYIFGLDDGDDGSIEPNNGAMGDPDGDSIVNLDELEMLTDPSDPLSPPAAEVVPPGSSPFVFDGSLSVDIGTGGPPIPADFFGPGSDPFLGQLVFSYEPLISHSSCPDIGAANVILERFEPFAVFRAGDSATVSAQLSAFRMKAAEPALVTYEGGSATSFFDVFLDVDTYVPGEMEVTRLHGNGGTFGGTLPFFPRLTFVKQLDPAESYEFHAGELGYFDFLAIETAPWVHYNAALNCGTCSERFLPGVSDIVLPIALYGSEYVFVLQNLCQAADAKPGDVRAGYDYFRTPAGAITFGNGIPPIPADFFGPGSEPFFGEVPLAGVPFETTPFCSVYPGPADTLLWRNGPAKIGGGDPDTVNVTVEELKLSSVSPISVGTAMYDVEVLLSPSGTSTGFVNIGPVSPDIVVGEFNIVLEPIFQFWQVDAPGNPPLVLDDLDFAVHLLSGPLEAPVFADDFECGTTCAWSSVLPKGSKAAFEMTGNGMALLMIGFPPQDAGGMDFGDAPDPSYATLLASDGARHTVLAGLCLGAEVDAELDGQPSASADGDDQNGLDDEDGVAFTSAITPGADASVEVTVTGSGMLNAWIDFNQDGSWAGADEQIFTDVFVNNGVNALVFPVPVTAGIGTTYARFRLNSAGGLAYTGLADDGEVEDYAVTISMAEGEGEGIMEGEGEGVIEGEGEGLPEGEGSMEGEGEGGMEGEGSVEGEQEKCPEDSLYGQTPGSMDGMWNFSSSVTGEDEAFDDFSGLGGAIHDIHWWGMNVDHGDNPATYDEYVVRFYANDGGVPGGLICEYTVTASLEDAGFDVYGWPVTRFDAVFDSPCVLDTGWVSIQSTENIGGIMLYWLGSDSGNGSSYLVFSDDTSLSADFDLSFCLTPESAEGEGGTEGGGEGALEGEGEGIMEGEGVLEGEGEGVMEGEGEGVMEGEGEGVMEGEGEGCESEWHSADRDFNNEISLTELLRVIQFFNMDGLYCAANPEDSEDGYLPGSGADHSCCAHDSDYNPLNWDISLTELLRLIQFFNSGGYFVCPGMNTEDGFCPGIV